MQWSHQTFIYLPKKWEVMWWSSALQSSQMKPLQWLCWQAPMNFWACLAAVRNMHCIICFRDVSMWNCRSIPNLLILYLVFYVSFSQGFLYVTFLYVQNDLTLWTPTNFKIIMHLWSFYIYIKNYFFFFLWTSCGVGRPIFPKIYKNVWALIISPYADDLLTFYFKPHISLLSALSMFPYILCCILVKFAKRGNFVFS